MKTQTAPSLVPVQFGHRQAMIDADVEKLLPFARQRVQGGPGPSIAAGDDGLVALAYAYANWEARKPGWCDCPVPGTECYWLNPIDGSHGFMCVGCRKLTQAG
jgi:hypothetical protein